MNVLSLYYRQTFWIKDFIQGSPIGKHYRELKRFYKVSGKNITSAYSLRETVIKRLLDYITQNSPFYKSYKGLSLDKFPVVTKSFILKHYDEMKIAPSVIPNQRGTLHIQSTSGSTGTPFAIPHDTEKRNRRIAELKYFGEVVGFKSHDMLVQLRTWSRLQAKSNAQIKKERIVPFDISKMNDERLAELVKTINDVKAICIRGYASSFDLLANYIHKTNIKIPSVKVIIAGSEALHDDVRAKVKANIGCEIISQYANEEIGILAQEAIPTLESDNKMYLNHASCVFEILKLDEDKPAEFGEPGRIVVSDLYNHAFPMLRYDTGDVGVMLPPDEKSKGWPVLGKIYGRIFDIIYSTNGEVIYPLTIGRILKNYDKILQWQFIQKGAKDYLIKVIADKDIVLTDYLAGAIISLKESFGDSAEIKLEHVDGIPVLASGKRKPVVNEWKNGES